MKYNNKKHYVKNCKQILGYMKVYIEVFFFKNLFDCNCLMIKEKMVA